MLTALTVSLVSATFWTAVYFGSKVVLPLALPQFSKWDEKSKYQACGLVPSTLFILVAVLFSTWTLIFDKNLSDVRIVGSTTLSLTLISIAFGYFIYDSIIIYLHLRIDGIALLVHGVLCSITYGLAAIFEVYNGYGPVFLLFEFSTIFVNFRWFLVELGKKDSFLYVLNGLLLVVVFGSLRIGYGLWSSYSFWIDTFEAARSELLPLPIVIWYGTSNICLNGLNVFWFEKIFRGALKAFLKSTRADGKDQRKHK